MRTFLGIGHILLCFAAPVTSSIQRNVSILINWNNVKGQVGLPGVTFLGKVQTTKEYCLPVLVRYQDLQSPDHANLILIVQALWGYAVPAENVFAGRANATGPFIYQSVALAPRNGYWDDGACHGVTVHRLKNGSLAMFYMGFEKNWKAPGHPNCTSKYDPTLGDHSGRRIGLAMGDSPFGPWKRFDAPVFGPCGDATKCWDNLDVSNPTPIIKDDGNVIFLYKGRGRRKQAIGLAFGPLEGPYVRNSTGLQSAQGLPGEDPWGWIDPSTGVIHALTHSGNGETSAGGHSYSLDGIHWKEAEMAYTGKVNWENGSFTVLERRERPQVLLSPVNNGSFGTPSILFTSAQPCAAAEDGGAVPCRSFTMLEEIDLS
eukprot:UC4_evm6s1075